jgi:peptide/nickel transport system permease protein
VRIVRAVATVWGVVTLVFLLVHLIPGDPIDAILGDQAAAEDRAALRKALRLDRPLPAQYSEFLVHDVLGGSLGHSFRARDRRVADLIAEVLPDSAALALASMLVAILLAIPLGTLAAVRRGTRWDKGASTLAVLGLAIPNIWLGPLLVLAFGVQLRWLPLPGDDPARPVALVLPAVTVGTALMAMLTRQTRAAMLDVLGEQYIHRLAARWGLSDGSSVERTERDLKALFPREQWIRLHLQIILFGREHCPALRHDMSRCPICSWAASKSAIAASVPKKT